MQTQTDERLAGVRQPKSYETPEQYAEHVRQQATKVDHKAELFGRLIDLVRNAGVVMPDVYCWDFQSTLQATWDCADAQAFRAVTKALGSTLDNPWRKDTSGGSYRLSRSADGIDMTIRATWVTCEQVQTGTEVKTSTEVVEPAKTRTVVNEVPVYEWRCPDSVLIDELADGVAATVPAEIGAG